MMTCLEMLLLFFVSGIIIGITAWGAVASGLAIFSLTGYGSIFAFFIWVLAITVGASIATITGLIILTERHNGKHYSRH